MCKKSLWKNNRNKSYTTKKSGTLCIEIRRSTRHGNDTNDTGMPKMYRIFGYEFYGCSVIPWRKKCHVRDATFLAFDRKRLTRFKTFVDIIYKWYIGVNMQIKIRQTNYKLTDILQKATTCQMPCPFGVISVTRF